MSRRPRRRRQHSGGQVVVIFALTLTLFLFGLIAMVADVATVLAASSDSYRSAQLGALTGAGDVDVKCFLTGNPGAPGALCTRPGTVQLLPQAKQDCETAGDLVLKNGSSCELSGREVTATVSVSVPLPVPLLGIYTPKVTARYTAFAQQGTVVPLPTG